MLTGDRASRQGRKAKQRACEQLANASFHRRVKAKQLDWMAHKKSRREKQGEARKKSKVKAGNIPVLPTVATDVGRGGDDSPKAAANLGSTKRDCGRENAGENRHEAPSPSEPWIGVASPNFKKRSSLQVDEQAGGSSVRKRLLTGTRVVTGISQWLPPGSPQPPDPAAMQIPQSAGNGMGSVQREEPQSGARAASIGEVVGPDCATATKAAQGEEGLGDGAVGREGSDQRESSVEPAAIGTAIQSSNEDSNGVPEESIPKEVGAPGFPPSEPCNDPEPSAASLAKEFSEAAVQPLATEERNGGKPADVGPEKGQSGAARAVRRSSRLSSCQVSSQEEMRAARGLAKGNAGEAASRKGKRAQVAENNKQADRGGGQEEGAMEKEEEAGHEGSRSRKQTGRKRMEATEEVCEDEEGRQKKKRKGSGSKEMVTGHGRKYYEEAPVGREVCFVGDQVYVKNPGCEDQGSESDEEVEECRLCGQVEGGIMVECEECLGGFHLSCVDPPLMEVPEEEWFCSGCSGNSQKAEAARATSGGERSRRRTARERFFDGELRVAEIDKLWRDRGGVWWAAALWFMRPEETPEGRQPHHGRRELLRSTSRTEIKMATVLRKCWVKQRPEYNKCQHEGDDVFLCDYEYDIAAQVYKRIRAKEEEEEEQEEEDGAMASAEGSGGDESGEEYEPPSGGEETEEEREGEREEDEAGGGMRKQRRLPKGGSRGRQSSRAANARARTSHVKEAGAGNEVALFVRNRHQSEFARAQAALQLSAVPRSMPCREKERREVEACVEEAIAAGDRCLGRCLYVSGVPGTGKTATVLEVIRSLGRRSQAGHLPLFQFVHINGLRLPSPQHVYSVLYEELTGHRVSWRRALELLEEHFAGSQGSLRGDRRPLVVLVDELDLLVTRTQSVLYNLFDWPTRSTSRLTIVGIANTMDLPERLLPRIVSRMGLRRCAFQPYTRDQLAEIVAARLEGIAAFQPQAVKLVAMKVAAVSGDVRRALEICRRAAEITEARLAAARAPCLALPRPPSAAAAAAPQALPNGAAAAQRAHGLRGPLEASPELGEGRRAGSAQGGGTAAGVASIEIRDVDMAIREMFEAPHILLLGRGALHERIFLVALAMELRRTGMADSTFEKVADTHTQLCKNHNVGCPSTDELSSISSRLGACRLLLAEPGGRHRLQKLQLNIPSDDIAFVLKKDAEISWLHPFL